MQLTLRKNRSVLPFAVKLKNYADIEFTALVKFYDGDALNHSEGVPLSFLSLEKSGIEIVKSVKREDHQVCKLKFNRLV